MSGLIPLDTPITVVETTTIHVNQYSYQLINLIPHTSVMYNIWCFHDNTQVKYISGLLDGEQYKEWTTDEWMDAFIKNKVEALNEASSFTG